MLVNLLASFQQDMAKRLKIISLLVDTEDWQKIVKEVRALNASSAPCVTSNKPDVHRVKPLEASRGKCFTIVKLPTMLYISIT